MTTKYFLNISYEYCLSCKKIYSSEDDEQYDYFYCDDFQ